MHRTFESFKAAMVSLASLANGKGMVVAMMAFAIPAGALAVEPSETDSAYLAQWLTRPTLTFGGATIETASLKPAYAKTNYALFWVDGSGLSPRASQALAVIAAAGSQGLNPELYNLRAIQAINAMAPADADETVRRRLSLELMMSAAVMGYATDMHSGVARHQWDTGADSMTATEQADLISQAANAVDQAQYLASMAPTSKQYRDLMQAYVQYGRIVQKGGWPAFTVGKTIKPGMQDARVASLREILTINGDLAVSQGPHAQTYDAQTAAGVKFFQMRHGIEADGLLGAATQAALSISAQQRMEQIAMTMERMRWMPRDLGNRYVLVNLPSYQLTAVAGGEELHMHVIVGKTTTPTPMFSKEITDIALNPSWSVPAKIAANEMLPKIRKNPNYLSRAGFTLASNGETVDPTTIDWSTVSANHFNYTIRQNPGDDNALGKVKFIIPDSDNIYLHDTSNRSMFNRAERDLSHGCVRLGDPRALTQFVLAKEGWSEAKIDTAYDNDASRTVKITPLPVHFVYWTSWVDTQGRAHFAQDIYGKDKSLMAQMSAPQKRSETIKVAMN